MEFLYTLYPQTKTEKELVKKSFLPFAEELGLNKNASVKEYIDTAFEKFLQGDYKTATKLAKQLSKTLAKKDITPFRRDFENYLHYNPIYAMATFMRYQNSMEGGPVQKNSRRIIANYIGSGGNSEIFHVYNLQNIEKYINEFHYVSFKSSIASANNFREEFNVSPIETLFELQYKLVKDEKEMEKLNQQLLSYENLYKAPSFIKSNLSALKGLMSYNKKNFNEIFDQHDCNMIKSIATFKDKYLETYNKLKDDTNPKTSYFNKVFLETFSQGRYYPENNSRIYNKVNAKINSNTRLNSTPSK